MTRKYDCPSDAPEAKRERCRLYREKHRGDPAYLAKERTRCQVYRDRHKDDPAYRARCVERQRLYRERLAQKPSAVFTPCLRAPKVGAFVRVVEHAGQTVGGEGAYGRVTEIVGRLVYLRLEHPLFFDGETWTELACLPEELWEERAA